MRIKNNLLLFAFQCNCKMIQIKYHQNTGSQHSLQHCPLHIFALLHNCDNTYLLTIIFNRISIAIFAKNQTCFFHQNAYTNIAPKQIEIPYKYQFRSLNICIARNFKCNILVQYMPIHPLSLQQKPCKKGFIYLRCHSIKFN